MTDKPSYYVMIQELTNLCARHNITINDIQRFTGDTDGYDISLTWEQQGHDGSVCQQLPLDDIENTVIRHVPKEEPVVDNLSTVEEEEIEAWKKLGAKEEPAEDSGLGESIMSASSAMTFKAKSHLAKYPNSVRVLNYLMSVEKDQWKLTKEVREQFGIDMSEWRRFMGVFGKKNGINVIESTGSTDQNTPSTVRYVHSTDNDRIVQKILGRVNA